MNRQLAAVWLKGREVGSVFRILPAPGDVIRLKGDRLDLAVERAEPGVVPSERVAGRVARIHVRVAETQRPPRTRTRRTTES